MNFCPNCNSSLTDHYRYCPSCGQRHPTHRLTMHHIGHEAMHALTHADKGIVHLLRELARRPGQVARDYIVEGKRMRYFNPFAFMVLALGVVVFINSLTHPYSRAFQAGDAAIERQLRKVPVAERASVKRKLLRRREALEFIERRNNVIGLIATPIIAWVFWLFFRRAQLTYAEHLAANAFFSGFYMLFSGLVLLPIDALLARAGTPFKVSSVMLVVQLVYLTWAYYGLLGYEGRPRQLLRTGLASLLAIGVWFVFSGTLIFLYIATG